MMTYAERLRLVKRILKRGPRLGRKQLAQYALSLAHTYDLLPSTLPKRQPLGSGECLRSQVVHKVGQSTLSTVFLVHDVRYTDSAPLYRLLRHRFFSGDTVDPLTFGR
jgi:hypothetical protein